MVRPTAAPPLDTISMAPLSSHVTHGQQRRTLGDHLGHGNAVATPSDANLAFPDV